MSQNFNTSTCPECGITHTGGHECKPLINRTMLDDGLKITIMYSCHECGLKDINLEVPARTIEDVADWVKHTAEVLVFGDHHAKSPKCRSRVISDLKIPIDGVDRIGGAKVN